MKKILVVVFVGLLAGCATASTFKDWRGHTLDELKLSWGPPDSGTSLSDGRRVFNYYGGGNCVIRVTVGQRGRVDDVRPLNSSACPPAGYRLYATSPPSS